MSRLSCIGFHGNDLHGKRFTNFVGRFNWIKALGSLRLLTLHQSASARFLSEILQISWETVESKERNDRRNSGGTLRQKFYLIDIWHLLFNIQPIDQWTKGPWTNGVVDKKFLRPYGKKNTLEHWNIWTIEHSTSISILWHQLHCTV